MNRRADGFKKVYTRVEDRKDYVVPENVEELLNTLEHTGALEGVLSPKFIHERLLVLYIDYQRDDLTPEESKDIINRAWNLSRPIVHQVIKRFRKTLDVYPHIRGDIMGSCSIVVSRTFREQRYDVERGTRITSYLFDFFIYAVLGCLSKYFKDKSKYISVDPLVMGRICFGETTDDPDMTPTNYHE